MKKERFDTITDAVIAIIITLMILEIKLPELTADNFGPLLQHIAVYALSFIAIAIAWLNHHHMFLPVQKVNTRTAWINFAFLFTLSLVPLATGPLGEHFFKRGSHMFYGAVLTAVSITYTMLQLNVNKTLTHLSRHEKKINGLNALAILLYGSSIPLSIVSIYISATIFILLPTIYFIQSKRLPRAD